MIQPIDSLRRVRKLIVDSFGGPSRRPGYRYQPGDTVIEDFAEFSGIPLNIVADRIANYHRINAEDWQALDAKSFSERAQTFYESSHNYIFDTLSGNPRPDAVVRKLDRFNPRIMEVIRAHPGRRFFEFGGGIGVFCEIMANMDKDVHYMELSGIVFDFAQWRFKKLGLKVTAIEAKAGSIYLPGKYDIAYTDAVIEHLPHVLEVEATKVVGQAVDEGGLLVFLVDLSGPSADYPMHHKVDIRELHDYLKAARLDCEDGYHKFCSIWRRPGNSQHVKP
jgi:2-polyprenyl-3-methyl-5-hydroxy-6-metoxy-1,4-benzoquinol methylase